MFDPTVTFEQGPMANGWRFFRVGREDDAHVVISLQELPSGEGNLLVTFVRLPGGTSGPVPFDGGPFEAMLDAYESIKRDPTSLPGILKSAMDKIFPGTQADE